jgi:hypothetical protein
MMMLIKFIYEIKKFHFKTLKTDHRLGECIFKSLIWQMTAIKNKQTPVKT